MDFFQLKQGVNESIEEYILQMQLKGKSAHMAENLLKHAILGGLRNEIRQVVMMHQIDTIEDIKRWGLVAESMYWNFKGAETTELAKAMVAEMREQ